MSTHTTSFPATQAGTQRVQEHFDRNVGLYVDKALPCYIESSQERMEQLAIEYPVLEERPFRVLDIGCGGGHFLDLFLERFEQATAWGIDLSSGMLGANHPSLRKNLRQANALEIPHDFGCFEVINIDTVMHHLICPSSYADTIRQIKRFLISLHRFLMPGGVVMIREIYHEFRMIENLGTRTIYELSTLRVPAPMERMMKAAGIATANVGVCFLTRAQWRELFDQAGYSVVAEQNKPWTTQPYRRFGFAASGDIHYVISRTRPRIC